MPFNQPPQAPPLQGLAAAKPAPSQQPPAQEDPKQLLHAAAGILQDAVSQFGPQIIMVLKQLLDTAPTGNAPQTQAPPPGPGGPPEGRM